MKKDNEQQRPLSCKFQSNAFWPEFHRELKTDKTCTAVILDVCSTFDWVSYSRTSRHYETPERYRNPLYTWRKVVSAVDHLAALGLVYHDRREPGLLNNSARSRHTVPGRSRR